MAALRARREPVELVKVAPRKVAVAVAVARPPAFSVFFSSSLYPPLHHGQVDVPRTLVYFSRIASRHHRRTTARREARRRPTPSRCGSILEAARNRANLDSRGAFLGWMGMSGRSKGLGQARKAGEGATGVVSARLW